MIPTPAEAKASEFVSLAGQAYSFKFKIIDCLKAGNNSVSKPKGMKDEVLKMIEPEFKEAGWQIVDHGISVTLRPL